MSLLDALAQGTTVVTANDRLARHLRWRFDRLQLSRGLQAWPTADILPWSAWLERLYRGAQSLTDPGLLTASQTRLLWQDIIANHPASPTLPTMQSGAARTALEAWQLMRAWHIPTQAVRTSSRSADTDVFADWATEFEARCRAHDWVDPWSLPDRIVAALSAGRMSPGGPVCFSGFVQPTAQQVQLMSVAPSIDALADGYPAAAARRVACEDPSHERELAARWARHMLEEKGAEVVGIIVPDLSGQGPAFRRTCLDVLAPDWRSESTQQLPVNIPVGQPLRENGLVHAGLLMLKLAGGRVDYRELGQVLRTVYLRGAAEEAGSRAALDLRLREHNERDIDLRRLITAAGSNHPASGFLESLCAMLEWGEANRQARQPSHWAASFARILKEVGWLEGLTLTSDDYQAARAWSGLLQTFASSSQIIGTIEREGALRVLNELAQNQIFQPQGRMDGVQIMAPKDVPGHRFDGVWICGLSSDAWPPAARPNALIPFELQDKQGLPNTTPLRARDWAADLMAELLASAPEALGSYPQRRGLESLVPSPMLPENAVSPDVIPQFSGATYQTTIFQGQALDELRDDPAPAISCGADIRGGSQLLKWQAACPARAFFEVRLGAREMASPAYGIDALLRGTMLHDALEILYSGIQALGTLAEIDAATVNEQIDRAIEIALRRHLSRHHPLSRALAANEQPRMRELLVELVGEERSRPRFTVDALEWQDSVTLGPVTLSVRQDRIDRFVTGERLVIDYKTGAKFAIKDWLGERPAEPQLPLYATMNDVRGIAVILLNHAGVKLSGVGVDSLEAAGLKTVVKFTRDEAADWGSLVGDWKRALNNLADEFANGDCRIDRNNRNPAGGEFAMLTRLYSENGRRGQ